ncbi:hypothetical protein CR513_46948, partial [Mucuna pruriens]
MVKRFMSSQVVEEVENQRENIFHSRCLVMGKLCFIIIDGGSSVNFASLRLVEKLTIPTFSHLKPYKFERGELLVDKKVALVFTLGNFEDKVVCDVVPMEATHILLWRLWQYDRRVAHNGVTNRFTFVHMGVKGSPQIFVLKRGE